MGMMDVSERVLVSVQQLHFRLLYCTRTVAEFESCPASCLAGWGLNFHWQRLLPETRSEGHRTEMRGRRIQAAQELMPAFQSTFENLLPRPVSGFDVAQAPWFQEFLSSDEFFDPAWSLPHPSGIGRAYEGYSRFFFWARRHFEIRASGADLAFRDDLYLDFAARLDLQQVTAKGPQWDRLRKGFFWPVQPGTRGPCRGLSEERRVISAAEEDAVVRLQAMGLCNLDLLEP